MAAAGTTTNPALVSRRPFNSEMRLAVATAAGPREVVLRRTRPAKQERVAPDAERFRQYLVETGFWQRAGHDVDGGVLETELHRLPYSLTH